MQKRKMEKIARVENADRTVTDALRIAVVKIANQPLKDDLNDLDQTY